MSAVLGSTGLPVSRIGLGLAALGRPAYITLRRDRDLGAARSQEAMERRAHEVMDAAYEAGIRYFDAARSYGYAERFLASWLERDEPLRKVTVGSKWGYRYTAGWRLDAEVNEVKDHSLEALRRQYAESRSILGDRLALYQIHSATLESGVLEDRRVLAELARLRDEGLVIGLTASGPRQGEVIRRALEVSVDGVNPFSAVQATWNVFEPSVGPALSEARKSGWGVIVKEALANGRLTSNGAPPAELARVADAHGVGPDAVALAAALSQPWASVCLSGAVSVDQLRSNVAAPAVTLSNHELDRLARLAEPPEQYWRTRAGLPWR
ncbi:MAG: aldo/keto reductase [Actinomycetota bacterium]|nr:aldo/keto reductase [Actinomycetota bacterium]